MNDVQRQDLLALLPDDKCRLSLPETAGLQPVEDGMPAQIARSMRETHALSDTLSVWEKQQRRLACGDTAAWRGALAAALLMECWVCGCRLEINTYKPGDSAFTGAALAASQNEMLRVAVLRYGSEARVLGIVDTEWGLVLPAARGGLEGVLPERLTWYDVQEQQFGDPCGCLCQHDRRLLAARLRLMAQTKPVADFLRDVEEREEAAADEPFAGAMHDAWLRCMKAVIGLTGEKNFSMLKRETMRYHRNPGHAFLNAVGAACPDDPEDGGQLLYTWRDVPFAYGNDRVGLELLPGAQQALDEMWAEYLLLETHSRRFVREMPKRINDCLALQKACFVQRAQDEMIAWCAAMLDASATQRAPLEVTWPWEEQCPALQTLFTEYLPEGLAMAAMQPFAGRLALMDEGALCTNEMDALCCVMVEDHACAALLPLSEGMALQIVGNGWPEGMNAAACAKIEQSEDGVTARLRLTQDGQVCVSRTYKPDELHRIEPENVPEVALWPAIPAAGHRWRAYWVSVRGKAEVRCAQNGAWTALQSESEAGGALRLKEMPRCAALFEENECLGVVCARETSYTVPHLGEAVIALDVGSSGTAVSMLLGGRAQPVTVSAMTGVMLRGRQTAEGQRLPVADAGPIVPMAVIGLTDTADPKPFEDGSIRLDDGLPEAGLEGNLLWRADARAESARRLYFRQLLTMCGFHAVMCGADMVSWCVTLPSAMAREGRSRLLREIDEACAWAEREAGILRAPGGEVLLQRESMAAGLYLRDGGVMRGAFAMLSVGSSCASMALWLRGMNRPATEFHIHGGVAAMLLPELAEDPQLLAHDLGDAAGMDAEKLIANTTPGLAALSYNHLLIDAALGKHLADTGAYMNAGFRAGRPSRTQALLLMGFAALMTLTGNALEQVRRNPLLNDYLPPEMQLALCGRGSLALAGMDPLLANAMTAFVRVPMSYDHPVRMLSMTLSGCAKLEAVLGVGASRPGAEEVPENTMPEVMPLLHLAVKFLVQLRTSYPWHFELLFPGMFDEYGRFTQEAEQRITAAADKCRRAGTEEGFLRCLDLLRSTYRIQPDPIEPTTVEGPTVHHFCAN